MTNITNVTHHSHEGREAQSGVDKKIAISVSAAIGGLLVVIATVICIVLYCKRRKRNNAAMYTAALYNASQDQCAAGIYDESHINLPSSIKSASMMSHSNPVYGRGQDMSITLNSSRPPSSPSRLQNDEPELPNDPKFIENESKFTDAAAPQPIKGRRNMIVAYENVIILADTPRESVPDMESFYENPGSQTPDYHVLENTEEVPSYDLYPSGSNMDEETHEGLRHSQDEEFQDSYNDRNDDEEPIYANSTSSPASTTGNTLDSNFPFEQPDSNDYTGQGYNVSLCDGVEEESDINANSEAIRGSYREERAINNPGYMPDDEEEYNN